MPRFAVCRLSLIRVAVAPSASAACLCVAAQPTLLMLVAHLHRRYVCQCGCLALILLLIWADIRLAVQRSKGGTVQTLRALTVKQIYEVTSMMSDKA